jgi:hypothetical protein
VKERVAIVGIVAALVTLTSPAAGVTTKYFIHDTAEELQAGKPLGVSIMSEGTLRLAPAIELLAEPEEPYLWDLAVAPDGRDVYLGTGDDGWVLRVRGRDADRFFQCAAMEVLSLLTDESGRVFAGTMPEGFVYRIDPDGTGELLFDADEQYVWDLTLGPDGKIYAGYGPEAVVYRIDPETGQSERFYEVDDHHVVSLAFDEAGRLLLGTEGRGLVIRVGPDGRGRVLHDTPHAEVGAVLAGPGDEVWAAASAASEAREGATPEKNADGAGPEEADEPVFEITPAGAGRGVLYRIDAEGNATRLWESGQGAIYALAWDPGGDLLATTGEEGAVYAVDPEGGASLLLDAEADQVVGIVPDPKGDGFFVASANPSRLERMSSGYAREGTYESEILDARHPARWGRIERVGEGSGVSLAVRTGNTDEPDVTWSEWGEELREESATLSSSERTRYLQWRITLNGEGWSTPTVRRVRVSAVENNLPPIVGRVVVVPAGNRFYDDVPELRPRPLFQSLPGGVKVQYSYEGGGETELPPEQRAPWTQGMRQIHWEAIDPNNDFLTYILAYRAEDEVRWKDFAEDVEGQNFTFNSNGVPDGEYRIRVTASDRRFNPGNELTASKESEIFLVDNSAPGFRGVKHRRETGSVHITGEIVDELSDIVRLEVSVNGEDWLDEHPRDGVFDSPGERFEVDVEAPPGAEHSILLRGTDLAGNLGTTRVLIRP